MFEKPIPISLSPNTQSDDVWIALQTLLQPWIWKKGIAKQEVTKWFQSYFETSHIFFSTSARSMLTLLLQSFGVGDGDEVIVQAFTCIVVPNSVKFAGATPVFADIDDALNLDPISVLKNITKKTKAIVIQHTFGTPAQMDVLMKIAKKYNFIVIEDLAHGFGASYKGKKLGTFGHAAMISFGRDKVLSSVWGGVGIIQSASNQSIERMEQLEKKLNMPSAFWIFQQLTHPLAFSLIIPLYDVMHMGKILLVFLQKIGLLTFPVQSEEKHVTEPKNYFSAYPNALAVLLHHQLPKLQKFIEQRRAIALYYQKQLGKQQNITIIPDDDGSSYFRFPLLVDNPFVYKKRARTHGVYIGDWYHNCIDPIGSDKEKIGYRKETCPHAEQKACHIINLPTRISKGDAKRVIDGLSV